MPHGPVVYKGDPRKAQCEVSAELSRVGRVQLINPVRLKIQLKVLSACQQKPISLGNAPAAFRTGQPRAADAAACVNLQIEC